MEHLLKTIEPYWSALACGDKTFEVRRNDRAFQKGDVLRLRKYITNWISPLGPLVPACNDPKNPDKCDLLFTVTFVLQGGQFGIEAQYCVMGLEPREEAP